MKEIHAYTENQHRGHCCVFIFPFFCEMIKLSSPANEINTDVIRGIFIYNKWMPFFSRLLCMGHLRFRICQYYRVEDNMVNKYSLPVSKSTFFSNNLSTFH